LSGDRREIKRTSAEIVVGHSSHAAAVVDIVFSALRSFGIEPDPERWEAEIVSFGRNPPQVLEFVALDSGHVIGVAVLKKLENGDGVLSDLYVTPSLRGLGHGKALLEHIVNMARAEGLSKLSLETRSEFTTAIALYETTGWKRGPDLPPSDGPLVGPDRTYFLELNVQQ